MLDAKPSIFPNLAMILCHCWPSFGIVEWLRPSSPLQVRLKHNSNVNQLIFGLKPITRSFVCTWNNNGKKKLIRIRITNVALIKLNKISNREVWIEQCIVNKRALCSEWTSFVSLNPIYLLFAVNTLFASVNRASRPNRKHVLVRMPIKHVSFT